MKGQTKQATSKEMVRPGGFEAAIAAHSEAFETAVDMLGPFPWDTPKEALKSVDFTMPVTVNRSEAKRLVRTIARSYWRDLQQDVSSPRAKETLKSLNAILRHCNGLAARLKDLTHAEIQIYTQSIQPGSDLLEWKDINSGLPPAGFSTTAALPQGWAVAWLESLSKHTRWVVSELEKRGDRGGNTNIFRQRLAAPSWRLIGLCWALLDLTPHLKPSGTTGGKLHQFIGAIDDLVTGKIAANKNRYGRILKPYATARRQSKELNDRIQALGAADPKIDPDIYRIVLAGYRPDLASQIPAQTLRRAEKLLVKWKAIQKILVHGPSASGPWKLG